MNTVRAAQKAGDFRVLYPTGAERITDIAWYLQVAIEQGLTILSWYENLPKEDVPPEYLWEDSEGLDAWWESVEQKKEDGMPTVSGQSRDDDEDSDGPEPQVMVQNDMAQFLKRG